VPFHSRLSEVKGRVCTTPHQQQLRKDELRATASDFVRRTSVTAERIGREYHKARRLGGGADATTALEAAIAAMRADGSLRVVSIGAAGGIKVLDSRNGAFLKISEDQSGIYEGSAVMADKPAKHELSALGFLHEALDGAHLTVPLVSCVDVTVRDGAASHVYRVQAFSALPISESTLRSGSDDGGATIHVCESMMGPLGMVAAALHLAPARSAVASGAVTVHSYRPEAASERDRWPPLADIGPAVSAVLDELGVGAGASEAVGACARLEREAAARGAPVVLDPIRVVRSRCTSVTASAAGQPGDGSSLHVLPFDVEGHILPSGERCLADTHRLCIPEVLEPVHGDASHHVVCIVLGPSGHRVATVPPPRDMASDAAVGRLAARSARVGASLRPVLLRVPGTGCVMVSWEDAPDRVIVSHPSLYWTAAHLTALFPPTAGRVLAEAGVRPVSPDEAIGGGDPRLLMPAAAALLARPNLASAAAAVRRRVAGRVSTGSDDVASLRLAVKAGLHERGLGLRHAWRVWAVAGPCATVAEAAAAGRADDAEGVVPDDVIGLAYLSACLPRPGSGAGLALEQLMTSTSCPGSRDRVSSAWLAACLAGRAAAVKGLGLGAESRASLAARVLSRLPAADRAARSWLWLQRRSSASVKTRGVGGRQESRLTHVEAGGGYASDAAAAESALLSELGHRQRCGVMGGEHALLQRLAELAEREPGSSELGLLAACRWLAQLGGRDALALKWLGRLLLDSGRARAALETYELALSAATDSSGPDSLAAAVEWDQIGACKLRLGDREGALEAHERALSTARAVGGESHRVVGSAWDNLGVCLARAGRFNEALCAFDQALVIKRAALGDRHFRVGALLGNIGMCRAETKDPDGALEALERALDILRAALGEGHPQVGSAWGSLGVLKSRLGVDGAMEDQERGLAVLRAALGDGHTKVGEAWCNLGARRFRTGDTPGALDAFSRALAIHKASSDVWTAGLGSIWGNVGNCRSKLGDAAGALEAYELCLTIKRATMGDKHHEVGQALRMLGMFKMQLMDCAGALSLLVEARDIFRATFEAGHPHRSVVQEAIDLCARALVE